MRRRKLDRFTSGLFTGALLSAGWGLLVILLVIMLFSFLLTKFDAADPVITLIASAALCAGAFSGGFVCAKTRRHHGLALGLLCGSLIFIFIFAVSLFFARSSQGLSGPSKLLLALLFGAVGGIVGVNTKANRF